jgi:hypothetical protein
MSLALAAAACGGSATVFPGGSGSGGSGGGSQGQGGNSQQSCLIDQPGKSFSFRITNVGKRDLGLAYGCGTALPIRLATGKYGEKGIGKGNAGVCEVSCDQVYKGYENWGCSDCGPGVGAALKPGQTVVIPWDRRVYVNHEAPATCSGHAQNNSCALGKLIGPGDATKGSLFVCTSFDGGGYCFSGEELIPFAIDLNKDELVIQVK